MILTGKKQGVQGDLLGGAITEKYLKVVAGNNTNKLKAGKYKTSKSTFEEAVAWRKTMEEKYND